MLENATRLCGAKFSSLMLVEGDQLRRVALHNAPSALVEHWRSMPLFRTHPKSAAGRAAATKQVAFDDDLRTTQRYRDGEPLVVAAVQLGGYRTVMSVPMLKDDELVGIISIYRQEVRPFTDKQIELVKNFAAQAVIAIENTRLLNELRQRTDDLSESLEQQTATSEVLKVISSSQGELEAVFKAILENATSICEAGFGNFWMCEGDDFRLAALHNAPAKYAEYRWRNPVIQPGSTHDLRRMAMTKQAVQMDDVAAELGPDIPLARLAGARTVIAIPMIKDDRLIGALGIYRQEVRPFTNKQIELLSNFAAQAVIAIENARLLNELREDLLQQQTATAEVLKVISSSTGRAADGFQACWSNRGADLRSRYWHHQCCCWMATFPAGVVIMVHRAEFSQFMAGASDPRRQQRSGARTRRPEGKHVHIHDVRHTRNSPLRTPQKSAASRTILVSQCCEGGRLVGTIAIYRKEVKPFTEKQIELLTELRRPGGDRHREHAAVQRVKRAPTISPNRCSSRPPPPTCSR